MNKKLGIVLLGVVVLGLLVWYGSEQRQFLGLDFMEGSKKLSVTTADVDYHQGTMGFYAAPREDGKYPGVVMIHEWWGLNDTIKDSAKLLASEGYRVLAVDLHKGEVATDPERARELTGSVPQAERTVNLRAAAKYLRDNGATKVASLGWCFGGGQSLQLALSGTPLDATVLYYGSVVTSTAELAKVKWPVLGIFGEADTSIPLASVEQFDNALSAAQVPHTIVTYSGVGHAFANPTGQNYAPEETKSAWERTLKFLGKHLQPPQEG